MLKLIALTALAFAYAVPVQAQRVITPAEMQALVREAIGTAPAAQNPGASAPQALLLGRAELGSVTVDSNGNFTTTVIACGSVFSSTGTYFYIFFANGNLMYTQDTGHGANFVAACSSRAAIAVHVTSQSGTTFTWDSLAWAGLY